MTLSKIKAQSMNLADTFAFTGTVSGTQAAGINSSADATAITINASENVGIGTTSPEGKLTVGVNTTSSDGIYINNTASGGGELDLVSLGTSYNAHGAGGGEVWLYSPDHINIGGANGQQTNIKFLMNNSEKMRIQGNTAGLIKYNGAYVYYFRGSVNNNATANFDIPDVASAGATLITAFYTHHAIQNYGASRISVLGNYAGGIASTHDIQNITSSGGGSFSFSAPGSNVLRITKNAGTYIGGGHYIVKVETYLGPS